MILDTSLAPVAADHHVHFFETDETLSLVVVEYLNGAIRRGDAALVVATAPHREMFCSGLAAAGVDVDAAVGDGRLWLRDAAEILALFSTNGNLDPERFESVIGALVREAGAGGRPVKIYGEMVALLWDAGDVTAAIELERLWNDLGESVGFGLFCAYPARLFAKAGAVPGFAEVCHHHARVVNGAPIAPDSEACRRFPSNAQTSRLARRFVTETLREWGHEDLADAALLVVSELVTNAVMHARSDVSIGIGRVDGGVRLIVGDTSPVPPAAHTPDAQQPHGRGLLVVGELAAQWGYEVVDGGKLIWADLVGGRH